MGVRLVGQAAEHVLHHDHRAVDDDAEVHRAERQQVRRDADPRQAEKGGEQRERDRHRDDECRPYIPQK